MKTYYFLLALFFSFQVFAQVGKDCQNPYIINSLPFVLTGQTTQGYGNDYTETDACNSAYMSGNDFVFQFTPSQSMNITITLTNTNVLVGLFLLDGCPNQPGTNCIAKVESSNGNPQMANIPVIADTTYYIIIDTYNISNLFPSTGFNISMDESHTRDIKSIMIFRPRSGCSLSNQTPLTLLFQNSGTDTIDTIICGCSIDNQTFLNDTMVYPVAPGDFIYHWFSYTADMSASPETYKVKMFAKAVGDQNASNDSIWAWITHGEMVSGFPYFEDFESSAGGWVTEWIAQTEPGTSWAWGHPNKPTINHAASGNNCWVTNLTGNYLSPENSYVLSPCFDFSQLTLPVMDLDIWYKTATIDIVQIEYSLNASQTDPGFTWHLLGKSGDALNWYNTPAGYSQTGWNGNSGGWIHARHALDSLGGKPYVIFRITLRGGINGTDEGFAFDNVKISESPMNDMAVDSLIYPHDSCSLSESENIKVKITNKGLNNAGHFSIFASNNGGQNYIEEIVTDTLSFEESKIVTFSQPLSFANPALYPITIYSALTNDENHLNDTLRTNVMHYPQISSYPYIDDFEQNNGLWYAQGLHSSWQWGIPNDTNLTSAASGTHLWATHLSGYHNLAEESYVTSPCFDLTSLHKPVFKSFIWYKETNPTYCQIQANNEINHSWGVLGSASDSNWYDAGYSWTNSSGGWKQVKHSLSNYANSQQLQLHYYFKGTVQNKGFAFDYVQLCDAPLADFSTYQPTKGGWYVYFLNQSERMDSCLWNFGDSTFGKESSPTHQYQNSDSVLVKLTVWNSCDVDSVSKYVHPFYISVPQNDLNPCMNVYFSNLNLYIQNICNEEKVDICVYTSLGKVVYQKLVSIHSIITTIPLPIDKKQLYIVRITGSKGTYVYKTIGY
jgi:hypothetical protein